MFVRFEPHRGRAAVAEASAGVAEAISAWSVSTKAASHMRAEDRSVAVCECRLCLSVLARPATANPAVDAEQISVSSDVKEAGCFDAGADATGPVGATHRRAHLVLFRHIRN